MTNFVSSVRFHVKEGLEETTLKHMKEFGLPEGAIETVVFHTGERRLCTYTRWESEAHLAAARPAMISFLDTVRGNLEELSADLGVTDPVSGALAFRIEHG